MGWRRKLEEFEADLFKYPLPRFWRVDKGELERKKYEDGEERLEISFRGLPDPDGGLARVRIDGVVVCEIQVNGNRGRQLLTTTEGDSVPKVTNGSIAEVEYNGSVALRGTFKRD